MTWKYVGLCLGIVQILSACGHQPVISGAENVRSIQITDTVAPSILYTTPGEEVRWTNHRANPIRLGFLTMKLLDEVSCERGLTTLFGEIRDLVTIPPGESVSLCFVRRGDVTYNVWLEPDNPRGPITPTATIRVRSGG